MKQRNLFFLPFVALAFFGQGCLGTSSAPKGPDLGVFKTTDGGQTWVQKKTVVSGPKLSGALAGLPVVAMAFDPQDRSTIYLGTAENGMLYTLDGGDSWQQPKTLTTGRVNAVAVDAKNKCTVYAVLSNKIFKTENCGRDWSQKFTNPRTDVTFTRLAIDWYNPTILFAGSSDGDIFKSTDGAGSWQVSKRVDGNPITSMAFDPRDSRILYVGTQSEGIFKTPDAGQTWTQIKKQFGEDATDARRVTQVLPDPVEANVVYDVSRYGILKTTDGGNTWKPLPLISPPGTVKINAIAVDPKNNKRLVIAGVATLQFSTDGGQTWTPKKLPSSQAGSALLIDPLETNIIYLGITAAPNK